MDNMDLFAYVKRLCQIYKFCDYCGARGYSLKLLLKSTVGHQACSCTLWPERASATIRRGPRDQEPLQADQTLSGSERHMTTSATFDLRPQSRGQWASVMRSASRAVTGSENLSESVGGPSSGSDDGSASVCHHNCTDQHLLIQQCRVQRHYWLDLQHLRVRAH